MFEPNGAMHLRDGERYTLYGHKMRTTVFKRVSDGYLLEVPRDQEQEFIPTGEHDHITYCCAMHNTHTTPHRGCIFR